MYYNDNKTYESINDYINDIDELDDDYENEGLSFDDFDFSSIPSKMQERAEELYVSEQSMNDIYDAFVTYENLRQLNSNQIPMLNGGWAFEKSGIYKGVITECERSRKSQFDYILKVLINGTDVKYIKFTHSNANCIYRSICDMTDKDAEYFDASTIIGKVVILDIRNNRYHGNKIFSNVDRFELLSVEDEEMLIKMIKTMLKYYDGQYE